MTVNGLRTLIQVNHKITSEDTDKLIELLSAPTNGIIYHYQLINGNVFNPYKPIVFKKDTEALPTFDDLDFALQEMSRFKNYIVDMNISTKNGVTYEILNNYFKHIFKPRDIFVPPILAYLQLRELLIVGGVDNIVIL